MRKILFFLAAICCMMFYSVPKVWGQASDGVNISVGSVVVTDVNEGDILGDGSVSYDATDHILNLHDGLVVLDGITISSNQLFGVKIQVDGTVNIENAGVALSYSGFNYGYPLTIVGDENAHLILTNTGSTDVPALVCAKAPDASDPDDSFILKAQGGIKITVDNFYASTASAILSHHLDLDGVTLNVKSPTGMDAYKSLDATPVVTNFTNECVYDKNDITFYKYTSAYPVVVNGFTLTDGKPSISGADMACISAGSVEFDPATNTLWVKGGFTISSVTAGWDVLEIDNFAYPDEPITVKMEEGSGNAFFEAAATGQRALVVTTPAILDLNGVYMDFTSVNGDAVNINSGASLTLRNSTTNPDLTNRYFNIGSDNEKGIVGDGDLIVERCRMRVYAKKELLEGPSTMTIHADLAWEDPDYEWGVSEKALVKKDDRSVLKATGLYLDLAAWYLTADVAPAGVGTVAGEIWKTDKYEVIEFPYRFTETSISARLKATGTNPDWAFYQWSEGSKENPVNVYLYSSDRKVTAQFSRNIKAKSTFYSIDAYSRAISALWPNLRGYDYSHYFEIPVLDIANYIEGAVYLGGKIYFIEKNTSNEYALRAVAFDGDKMGATADAVVNFQTTYTEFAGLALNHDGSKLYLIAKKGADNVLLSINPASETAFTEVATLPAALVDKVLALAINSEDKIYVVAKDGGEAKLFTLNAATNPATEIMVGVLENIDPALSAQEVVMLFAETDELILQCGAGTEQPVVLVDPATAKTEFIASDYYRSALFLGPQKYAITGKPSAEGTGSGNVEQSGGYANTTLMYNEGEQVTLKASAAYHCTFVKWSDGETDAVRVITVGKEDKAFYAIFDKKELYTITAAVATGQDTWGDAYADWSDHSDAAEGEVVRLDADPSSWDYAFVEWAEDHNTENPRMFIVGTEDKTFTAVFKETVKHTLTVTSGGNGSAQINVSGGLSTYTIPEGESVNIQALPSSGYVFDQWEDGNTDNPRTITMGTSDIAHEASFISGTGYTIELKVEPYNYYGKAWLPGGVTTATYKDGVSVEINAQTRNEVYYKFKEWKEDGVTDAKRTITVSGANVTLTAVFEQLDNKYIYPGVDASCSMWGYYEFVSEKTFGVAGDEVEFRAVPASDEFQFVEWKEDHNTDNPRKYTIQSTDPDYIYFTAIFEYKPAPRYTIAVESNDVSMGTAEIEGVGASGEFKEGTVLSLKATPKTDYEFVEWDDHNTDATRSFTVGTEDKTFKAIFQATGTKHTITVAVESGQEAYGEVNINGSGTTGNFTEGSNITLNAIATDPSYEFDKWADDPSAPATRTIEVGTADATYTASFKLKPVMYTISVAVDDALHGDVWLTGGLKTGDFEAGTEVMLFVSHLDGFVFEKWNDDNTDNPRTITVTADASYTAIFKAGDAYTIELKVEAGQESMGSVSFPDVPGVSVYDFAKDAEVKIKAEAKPGYAFDKWDDDDTNAERTVTVTENKVYTASFKDADKVEIEVAVAEGQAGWGTVKIVPGDVTKGEFAIGANITLVATAADGYKFVKWDDENTNKDRVITVAEAKKFIASFEKLPEVKKYPVYIGGVQLTNAVENLAVFAGNSDFPALKYGAIQLDAENKVLTLSGAVIETSGDVVGLVLGDETASGKLEIVVVGDCKITSATNALELKKFSGATVKCEGTGAKLTVKSDAKGIALDGTALTLYDVALQVVGGTFGIVGTSEYEVLTVVGGDVQVEGTASGSVVDVTLVMNYVDLAAGYSNNETDHRVDKGAAVAKDNVVFGSYPKLTVKGVEKGSGRFKLVAGSDDPFYDTGWFKNGVEVTITAEAEDNFEFVRWMDDVNWKDKDLAIKAERKHTMSGDKEFTALFYHDVKSSATWYGVSAKENKFLSFSFEDRGKEFVKATTSASSVKAGDYVEGNWVTVEASNKIKVREFDEIEDGEAMPDAEELEKKAPADLTDMAYDLLSREMYGVAGNKLYMVDLESGEAEELGTFDYDGYPKTAAAIAVDAKRTIYILAQGTPGALFTVKDIADKKVSLTEVGDPLNHGALDVDVTADEQSMAFDHVTGELFWGAKDYLRLLDLEEAKAHIVGDLGQTGGAQGFIKSMHRKDKKVTVRVQFADGQDGFGTISITPGNGAKADVIVGTKVTLVAKPNAGYKFLYWRPTSGTGDDITEAEYTFSPKKNVTYEAHFKKMDEGFENVSDELNPAEKMIINGQLFILRNGKLYNAAGVLVK